MYMHVALACTMHHIHDVMHVYCIEVYDGGSN